MQKAERFKNIDLLRGISIVVMILTHTNAYFWDKWSSFVWNYLHFAVATFVFCSGFVLISKYKFEKLDYKNYLSFIKKRFLRLLLPYYIFVFFYYLMVYIQVKKIDFIDLQQAILVIREPDISWLVNLFLQLTIFFPIFSFLFTKERKIFNWIFGAIIFASFLKIFINPKVDYKLIMVFLWFVPFLLSFYIQENYKNLQFKIRLFLVFITIHILLWFLLNINNMNLVYQNNKYPPNLYYLTYGISFFIFADIIFTKFSFFQNKYLFKIINFFSVNSFSLFFIQYIVIQSTYRFIKKPDFTQVSFFFWVLGWCVIIQLVINFFLKSFKKK